MTGGSGSASRGVGADSDGGLARVEISRRCIEALNARRLDDYFAYLTRDFVLRTAPGTPGGRIEAGRAALERFYSSFFAAWDDLRYEFIEGPMAVGERVLSKDRWTGRERGTGRERSIEFFSVASFRDTLASSVDVFLDPEEAMEFARGGQAEGE